MSDIEAEDDLRGQLASALSGDLTADAPVEADLTGDAPAEPKAADTRSRDEQGRFAPKADEAAKPRDTLTLKDKTPPREGPASPVASAPVAGKPAEPAATDPQGAPPPLEWKGQAKVDWQRLPKGVQAAIRETYDSIQQAGADTAPIKELIDTNREYLVNAAGSVPEAFRQMVQFARMADTVDGTVTLVQNLLRRQGIDPAALVGGQRASAGTAPNQPTDIQTLVAQSVQQALQPLVAQQQQTETSQYVSQIQAFAADSAANPYFNDVKAHMAALLRAGTAKDLRDAYDQAVWANPSIRAQLLAKQSEDKESAKAAEVAAAQNARRASLTGSPLSGAVQANGLDGSDGSIRGDLHAAYRRATGAV